MKKIRTILVDDEPLALRGLAIRLENFEDIEIIAKCRNGREAIKAIRDEVPDLVFLDIQMPGFDGFSVVKALIGSHMPLIVFVTAFNEYALDAFEANAQDYLLKPVEQDRLAQTMDRIREELHLKTAAGQTEKLIKLLERMDAPPGEEIAAILEETQQSPSDRFYQVLHIKDRGHITRVEVRDIDYIDAAGDYLCIHVGRETHILRSTMKSMEKKLDPEMFQRIHRSSIVNMNKVKELHPHSNGECYLVLESGSQLKVSRSYRDVIGRFL